MEITSLGHASFKIRGKLTSIVTDPFASDSTGLTFPRSVTADIVTVSHDHDDHNNIAGVGETPFVIRGPGEYEIHGVSIIGFPTFHDNEKGAKRGRNTVFRIEVDGVSIVHAGDLGHELTSEDIERINGVDVLLLPVGGVYTIDAVQAAKVTHAIEPMIVIPMHYFRVGLNKKTFAELLPLSAFLKEMGNEDTTPQPKLSITKDSIPEELTVVVLESK
jgi:L-ascorbate metabolism protein UlaG (beta-lactamase superfamily)